MIDVFDPTKAKSLGELQRKKVVVATQADVHVPVIGVGNLVGYLPCRGEFEVEYNNEFEQYLGDMEFRPDDSVLERDLKLKMLELYSKVLDSRETRKKFIINYGLLFPKEKKRTREEKEVFTILKPLSQFFSHEEMEQHQRLVLEEMRTRKRIEQLQFYRSQGFRTLAQAEAWAAERMKDGTAKLVNEKKKLVRNTDADSALGPEGHALSDEEKMLCHSISLSAKDYLFIKNVIIEQSQKKGAFTSLSQPLLIDIERKSKVVEFFVSCGWVQKEALALEI